MAVITEYKWKSWDGMRVEYLFGIFFPLMCWTTLFVSEIYLFFNRSAVVMIEKVVYLFLFSHSVFCRKSWNCLLFLFSLSFSPPTPFFLLLKPVRTDPDEALEVVSEVLTTDHVTGRKKRKWCPSADEKKTTRLQSWRLKRENHWSGLSVTHHTRMNVVTATPQGNLLWASWWIPLLACTARSACAKTIEDKKREWWLERWNR